MAQTKIPRPIMQAFTALHTGIYRLSRGRIGRRFGGTDAAVLLTTTGRRSGRQRTVALIGQPRESGGWTVIASNSGHDHHPAWYRNLVANPVATVQAGADTTAVRARILEGEERAQAWRAMADVYADYDEYAEVADREIPVVALEPTPSRSPHG